MLLGGMAVLLAQGALGLVLLPQMELGSSSHHGLSGLGSAEWPVGQYQAKGGCTLPFQDESQAPNSNDHTRAGHDCPVCLFTQTLQHGVGGAVWVGAQVAHHLLGVTLPATAEFLAPQYQQLALGPRGPPLFF